MTDLNKIAEAKFPYPILKDGRQAKFNIIDVTICQRDAYISGLQDSGMVKALERIKTLSGNNYNDGSGKMVRINSIATKALAGINETKDDEKS